MRSIIVIAHNIRSTHNVGSIFRTCDGFGVKRLILSGYTPYPEIANDTRLPHISHKLSRDIHKTALGAEHFVTFAYQPEVDFAALRHDDYQIVALEQTASSVALPDYIVPDKVALLLGEEVDGITADLLSQCDTIIEIPMTGRKESFNVSVATGIALYHLRMA